MNTSLIISTYNRPSALKICLESIRRQTLLPNEVIIADDGSTEETKECVDAIARNFPVPIKYIWQPDEGFQLAKIRNKAIATARNEFIIQIDGDVFLHKEYIKDFVKVARKGYCILGSRVGLNKKLTNKIESSGVIPRIFPWTKGICQKPARAIYFPLGRILSKRYKIDSLRGFGCSMGFWKDDFISINGYDERFVGWGCEDRDLILRFLKSGIHTHKLMFVGIVYHLWHKEADRSNHKDNRKICYGKDPSEIICAKGVSQYMT